MYLLLALSLLSASADASAARTERTILLQAEGHDSRIDLRWLDETPDPRGYDVYRASTSEGPFRKINRSPHETPIYSDFIGENGRTYCYRVEGASAPGAVRSNSATAASVAMSDEELLTSVQAATFRYFWDFAHPTSGMAYERGRVGQARDPGRRCACATGGTGFGLMAIIVGAERGFVTRDEAAERVLKIVAFLEDKADRFHGAWPHWLDGETGRTIPFSVKNHDDGADLVETAFLMQGMLTVQSYFDKDDPVEAEIRTRVARLWREVEWDFFLQHPDGKRLYWHWSPNHGFKKNLAIVGYNECLIAYVLAIASPTHPISPECYDEGWASGRSYVNGREFLGVEQPVGWDLGGPLFLTHYSFVGLDPRGRRDAYCDYFVNGRNTALIHRAYCIEHASEHKGYGETSWGLTASDGPDGYRANAPGRDDGTIAPTAAIGSMPFTPEASIAALRHYYFDFDGKLWSECGFRDAFNVDRDWCAESWIAIDQGPIICMIENHRTQLCWRMFMKNPEIAPALQAIGWTSSDESPDGF